VDFFLKHGVHTRNYNICN